MSCSWFLLCDDHKRYLWVGQAPYGAGELREFTFYSGEPDTMEKLRAFLFTHREPCRLHYVPECHPDMDVATDCDEIV